MLRFKNHTEFDRMRFGLHFAEGATVDVPERIGPRALEWLRANFTEVFAEPVKAEADTPIIVMEPVAVAEPVAEAEPSMTAADVFRDEPKRVSPKSARTRRNKKKTTSRG